MCPLCLRADFSTRLRLAWTTNGTLLLLAFQTRVRSPAAFQRPPCVLATRLLLCARRLVAWRHTCVQLRSPHNRIRTHCSQAHTYAGTGREPETTIAIKHAAAKTEHAKILVTTHHQAARERVAGDRVAGDRAAGDRAAGDRAAGDRERQATERRTADRACRGRACTRHRFRILCMYFVACVVYWQ